MNKPLVAFWGVFLGIAGAGLYGFLEGVPDRDIAAAVRAGDLPAVQRLLARDPALANTRLYPQGYERADQRRDYLARTFLVRGRPSVDPCSRSFTAACHR